MKLIDSRALQEVLAANPGLPICVFARNYPPAEDWDYCPCQNVEIDVGEVLNYDDEDHFTDRDELMETLYDRYVMEAEEGTEEHIIDEMVRGRMAELEPHWEQCIIIWVS